MTLPLSPPIEPMLAKLKDDLPEGPGWIYEPKWDGFRALVWRDGDDVTITSRDKRPFERYFPELLEPLAASLPEQCIVDGEIIIVADGRLDFDGLLLRIHPAASRIKLLAAESPARYVAFDLLALGDDDLTREPFEKRRAALEASLKGGRPTPRAIIPKERVAVTPETRDVKEAATWFDAFDKFGLDGVIAKTADVHYKPGERAMVKVKRLRTVDCVVGGYRLSKDRTGIGSLLLGLYDDAGTLHYVGHTSSFRAPERRRLLEELKPLEGHDSFGRGRTPGGPSRWTGARDVSWVPVKPVLVCEVSMDRMQGDRFRHAATFLRWRPEKPPEACKFDQVTTTAGR